MCSDAHGRICTSVALQNGGVGVCFDVECEGETLPAFAVRYQGQVSAFLNQCRHMDLELDWDPGNFFDVGGQYLVCATHGALYEPRTGACAGGPCDGRELVILPTFERHGSVYLSPESSYRLVGETPLNEV